MKCQPDEEIVKELEPKLRKLWNSDDYVSGIITFAESNENLTKVSQFIDMAEEMGETVTSDNIADLVYVLTHKDQFKKGE